ncbi:tyrosine-type recombinase/integrase [Solitalea koreensis]|uniref:Site-specific recombinase XerD n=1 Tax=Solitalea koreensis TaxID=543615 RepID=A0A521EE32_9SPHI|nr:tyrosine-type recombinase/integrase [Solitalea koreensis]SMO82183.1 Site-specific recombinase XerD [Solitalea koreensis]
MKISKLNNPNLHFIPMNLFLLDETKRVLLLQQKSLRTQQSYSDWIYRFLIFNKKHSPDEFNEKGISMFLDFLSKERHLSAATCNLALQAILFLYRNVLHQSVENKTTLRMQKQLTLPETLTRNEINLILNHLKEETRMMVSLLYGCGLNLKECLSLQISDIDLCKKELFVKSDNSSIRRKLSLPDCLLVPINDRIQKLKLRHEALERLSAAKKTNQSVLITDFHQQLFFPATKPGYDANSGQLCMFQRSDGFLTKAINKAALEAGIFKRITCHMFRHSYAVHLLERGYSVRVVQKLLGHVDIRSTMIYTRVLNANTKVLSPLDELIIR